MTFTHRPPALATPSHEAAWLRSLAAELRGGASLRAALATVADGVPGMERAVRLAASGAPLTEVADLVAVALPTSGRAAAAAIRIVAKTGGRASAVFSELAAQADAAAELAASRRAATAQARMSASVVGALPLILAGGLVVSGRAASLLQRGEVGIVVLVSGLTLQLIGLLAVAGMLRRSAP
jgi:tight adherence protein B